MPIITVMEFVFESNRLGFRLWTIEDAEACFVLAQDEHVGPPCGWPPHKTLEESRQILQNVLMNDHTFCIVEKTTGDIIGNMGIDPIHEGEGIEPNDQERELGYWLGYPYWNKGYMTEAVEAACEYCFHQLGYTKLWCGNFSDNPASGIVQEKNGFQYVKTVRIYWDRLGREVDLLVREKTHHHEHTHEGTKNHGHYHENTKAVLNRIAKTIGHLEKVKHMIENGEDCSDVLIQLSAVKGAINATSRIILKDHMEHCIVHAIEDGNTEMIEQLNAAIDQMMK